MTPISPTKENILLLLFGILGLGVFLVVFPRIQPSSQMDVTVDRTQALVLAKTHLNQLIGNETTEQYTNRVTTFGIENRVESYFKHIQASATERQIITQHSTPQFWNVSFENPIDKSSYQLRVGIDSTLTQCTYNPPPDLVGSRLLVDEAEQIARDQLSEMMAIDWSTYSRIDANTEELESRTDHSFTWRTDAPVAGEAKLIINATVTGDKLSSWMRDVEFPRDFEETYTLRNTQHTITTVAQVIFAIFLWVISLFVFALRFRASEVSIRNGLIVSFTLLVLLVLFWGDTFHFIREFRPAASSDVSMIVLYINIGLQVFFICFGLFFIWMSGESLMRDIWPDKLKAIDGLFARRFFFPDLGRSILRGYSLGLLQLGVWYLILMLIVSNSSVWPTVSALEQQIMTASSTSFFMPFSSMSYALYAAILSCGYTFLFVFSLLKKLTKRTAIAVVIPWLIFSSIYTDITIVYPQWITSVLGLVIGLLSFYFFLRFDLLTVFVGTFLHSAFPLFMMYLHQDTSSLTIAGFIGIIVLIGIFIFGLTARMRGVPLNESAIIPAYARNITERQRLKLELDVARRAQLQMLPSSLPETKGLDIAAFSEPAREVGGDYFDFFYLDDNRLGFAVGDVSGKGMPAALYMTLLKGSLQSQATINASPKELLGHINRTFYRTAERNTFVTLLYGVIDLDQSTLTFARAGHNPVLIYRPMDQVLFFLKPPGLGIGLEQGDIFDRTLEEESFALQRNDTIIVYTDGLTEARNSRAEEFGQDRLNELIKSKPLTTAEELLQRIKHGYFSFTGRAEPHDDLTCLIVKVQ